MNRPLLTRRRVLIAAAAAAGTASLSACVARPSAIDMQPVVFVHGNGDTAGLWITTLWRFESNGWPRDRLHAIDMGYPLARDDDAKEQPGRSSSAEYTAYLAAEVKKVLAATGAAKVALVGSSRGGYRIRNFIANGGGAAVVSHAVLCGVPNHGVWSDPAFLPGSECNATAPFLLKLNAPQGPGGDEVTPGVAWMTIRSDNNDKYAQPDGIWIGARGTATNVTFQGPALKGAENVVIAGIDHRETAFSAQAFAEMYRFIAGRPPATLAILPEAHVVLDGVVSGLGLDNRQGNFATNLPLRRRDGRGLRDGPGDRFARRPCRASHDRRRRWPLGPFIAHPTARYEFAIAAPGYATTHVYRSPFPRSSSLVSLRPERLVDADRDARSLVTLSRPRGYFGVPRDRIALDGKSPPAGIPSGVPGVSTARLKLADPSQRAVVGEFNDERIVGRTWLVAGNHVVVLELTY